MTPKPWGILSGRCDRARLTMPQKSQCRMLVSRRRLPPPGTSNPGLKHRNNACANHEDAGEHEADRAVQDATHHVPHNFTTSTIITSIRLIFRYRPHRRAEPRRTPKSENRERMVPAATTQADLSNPRVSAKRALGGRSLFGKERLGWVNEPNSQGSLRDRVHLSLGRQKFHTEPGPRLPNNSARAQRAGGIEAQGKFI
jgi:hypothetical protein